VGRRKFAACMGVDDNAIRSPGQYFLQDFCHPVRPIIPRQIHIGRAKSPYQSTVIQSWLCQRCQNIGRPQKRMDNFRIERPQNFDQMAVRTNQIPTTPLAKSDHRNSGGFQLFYQGSALIQGNHDQFEPVQIQISGKQRQLDFSAANFQGTGQNCHPRFLFLSHGLSRGNGATRPYPALPRFS
jgi:hypothetical protein